MEAFPSTPILGLPVHVATLPAAVAWTREFLRGGAHGYVCHVDVNSLMAGRSDPDVAAALSGAAAAFTDGMPLVWIARARGLPAGRVYGPDFMSAVLADRSIAARHFLYGSTPDVLARLAARVRRRYPGAIIAGALAPPVLGTLSVEAITDDCRRINAAAPDIVWVALGAPKQELWMAMARPLLDAALLAGVGAAFDFLSGNKPQAPRWMQRAGLEWLFRLASEPRRLAGRYGRAIPSFCLLLARERLRRRP